MISTTIQTAMLRLIVPDDKEKARYGLVLDWVGTERRRLKIEDSNKET